MKEDKEKLYAKLSSRASVVVIGSNAEGLLDTKPNDLRDRNLIRVDEDIVDRITISASGKDRIVLARKGESWVRSMNKEVPINASNVARMLTDLRSQQVTKFEADVATDLVKYGLEQPTVSVTLSSYASENTAETKQGEKPIVTIMFGKVDGEVVYAKLDEEPFVVSVPKGILDSIFTDPVQWQELSIYRSKPEEVSFLEVSKGDEPAVLLEREKDKWKLTKGDGLVNQANVQSLANTLSNLRAVRWIGATVPEHGFAKPTVSIGFKAANDLTGKLVLGAMTPNETWYATAEGLPGTFEVSRPDEQALVLPLLDKAAAAAPAAVSAPAPVPATPAPSLEAPPASELPN